MKQLSRDPQAAERARRAERRADAEAGLVVVDTAQVAPAGSKSGGGGFKKGGFKSSFAVVSGGNAGGPGGGSGATSGPGVMKKNVLGDDDDEEDSAGFKDTSRSRTGTVTGPPKVQEDVESDTDEEYADDELRAGGGYYDPRKPTGCFAGCKGTHTIAPVS